MSSDIYGPDIPGRHFSNAIIIWKIKNFSLYLFPTGSRRISSEVIDLPGPLDTEWRFLLEISEEFLILTVEMLPTKKVTRKVKLNWESYILNDSGEGSLEKERTHSFVPCGKAAVSAWRLRDLKEQFSTKSTDILEIKCHMLVDFGFRPHFMKPVIAGLADLIRDSEGLPKSFLHHDIVTKVSDEDFSLHRAMLCHRGEKLAELTKNPDVYKNVTFPFSNAKAAEAVFTYLYTGDLKFVVAKPSVTICEYIDRLAVPEMKNIYPKEKIIMTTEIDAREFSYNWTIVDFKSLKQPLKRIELHSGPDDMPSCWQLCIYPTVSKDDTRKRVESLRIEANVLKCKEPLDVSLEFSVITMQKAMSVRRIQGNVSAGGKLEVSFFENVNEVLEYLLNGSAIKFKFNVKVAISNEITSSYVVVPYRNTALCIDRSYVYFTRAMLHLQDTFDYSDALFEVEERPYKVHKFLMAARSPLFEEIFRRQATVETIKFPADHSKCMGPFISFLYAGILNETNTSNLIELWEMSENVNFKSLQKECEDELGKLITDENVLHVLLWARCKSKTKLSIIAHTHVINNPKEVITGPYWDVFCSRAPHLSSAIKNIVREMSHPDPVLNERCRLNQIEREWLERVGHDFKNI